MTAKRVQHIMAAVFGGILLSAALIISLVALSSNSRAKTPETTPLELYSHWVSGAEGDGLNALIGVFTSTYTDTSVTVFSDYDELANRIISGNPPDSFTFHCGGELIYTWVNPGDYIMPVTLLWASEGWMDKFPQHLIDMLTYKGELYCVPLNIHRNNVLWYNKHVFTDNGITPPTTFDEFFTIAEALNTAGKIPLAWGDMETWTDVNLMESVLLGTMGPDMYRGLWNGTTPFDGPEVRGALATFDQMMNYVNADHATLTWGQAMDLVGTGAAGMTIMGDWAEYYLESLGLTPDVDYGWAPMPGSAGSFMVVTDTFVMPRYAPNVQNATNWLKTVGSVEGQDTWSPFKGSIPARLDANPALYGVYQQSAIADYTTNELTPSLMHGVTAPPSFVNATDGILQDFIANGDIEHAAHVWQIAACEAGFGTCEVFLPVIIR